MSTTTAESGSMDSSHPHDNLKPVLVWDIPTRIFHWTLAASFAGAWLTAESERLRDLHLILGYTLAGLIVFRLVWGFVGSQYARFASFVAGPGRVAAYLGSLLKGRPEHHVGHNPAGGVAILLLLGLGAVVAASGWATLNELGGEWVEDIHEAAAQGMLAVVFVHIAGVVVSSFLHKENLVVAMFTGMKQGLKGEGVRRSHAVVGVLLALAVAGFWGWTAADPQGSLDTLAGPGWSADQGGGRHGGRGRDDD